MLKASQEMLPWFAATGHNNYAKYCRLYLQDWMTPCSCLLRPLRDGLFTILRKDNQFWSGTWSDMTIEQSLMRAGKTPGGLINITHKDGARTKWLLSAHVMAQYTDAIRTLTRTTSSCWFDHHRDLNPGRISQDFKDMHSILQFLKAHNPFKGGENSQLRNIATGLIADDRVNIDKVMTIGNKIQDSLTNKCLGEVTFKKSQQAITFAVMKKPVKLSDGELIRMSSTEMYQRLLSLACASGPPSASVFSFELSAVAPALFHEDGSMRKSQKSHLARHILNSDTKVTATEKAKTDITVFDGCAVLQQMKWPKVGTLHDVCLAYNIIIQQRTNSSSPSVVVFDSYEVTTTKELEQERRRLMKTSEAEVVVEAKTPVPSDQSSFLANKKNKQNFINLLSGYLRSSGIDVEHAGMEGDADVVIVREAARLCRSHQSVQVISDDTDVLVLLIYHMDRMSSVYMQTRACNISIKQAQLSIGETMCNLLPFLHAISGCDTTSSIYGFGKVRHFNYLSASAVLQEKVQIFGDAAASTDDIQRAGETYVSGLYPGGCQGRSLNALRYLNKASTRYVPIERMPPTSRACYFHSLRVHFQVNTWLQLRTVLNKEEYCFSDSGGNFCAVITDSKPAPPELLKEIRCACKSATKLCNSCNCQKMQIPCSVHCKCEGVCHNGIE